MWSFSKTYQLYELILLKKNKNSKVKDYISFLNNPSNGLTCKERPFWTVSMATDDCGN